MEKFKALDYNGASIYFNWGYHSPKKGVYDFQGVRDIQKAFDAAKQVGIHVISRPGPYINAEVVRPMSMLWLCQHRLDSHGRNTHRIVAVSLAGSLR